ncbi:MAG: hypothetical protein H7338_19540, partial [Candidatus Sericytochromatia bacterium]|nr:hypothetical protein [Candidatus Sericytochromatia bacterium]
PSIVILPAVFEAVLQENRLTGTQKAVLAAARHDDVDLGTLTTGLSDALPACRWPDWVQDRIWRAIRTLPGDTFAVRSSATLEDTGTTASAGVFETELNVDRHGLFAAMLRCWAAAIQPRVFHHLLSQGVDPGQLQVALIVQAMVPAKAAGVLFTVDPMVPAHTHMRLGVTVGLGESLVQGEAGIDALVARSGPVTGVGPLAMAEVTRLRHLGNRIERMFKRAMDIECAQADSKVWLLQARPITDLPPGAETRPAIRWSRDLAEERFPDPISTLGWTALHSALRVNLDTLDRRFGLSARRPEDLATVIGGYVYNNRDFFAIPQSIRFRLEPHLPYLAGYVGAIQAAFAPKRWRDLPKLRAPKRGEFGSDPADPRFRLIGGLFDAYLFQHADEVEKSWTAQFAGHLQAMDALDAEDTTAMDPGQLTAYARRVISRSDAFMEPDLAIYVIKIACRWALEQIGILVDGTKDPAFVTTLTGGLQSNVTQEMNESLDALFVSVHADSRLAGALRDADPDSLATAWAQSPALPLKERFQREYGHIGLSWDIRAPVYRDQPSMLDDLLRQRLQAGHLAHTATTRAPLTAQRAALADRVRTALGVGSWAAGFFDRLQTNLHTAMRLDEEHHLFCGKLIPAERRIVARLADHFVTMGAISQPDDIHFLTLDEVFAIAAESQPWNRHRLVTRRRLAFERASLQRPVMDFHGPVAVAAPLVLAGDGRTFTGEAASAGMGEGLVRVVRTMADLTAFRPGEILVTPTPKPSYTPLFAIAGGLISARGSTLSHGLISAREYGLPAVTEIHDACDRLQTGQRVRVDGSRGTVTVISEVEPPTDGDG